MACSDGGGGGSSGIESGIQNPAVLLQPVPVPCDARCHSCAHSNQQFSLRDAGMRGSQAAVQYTCRAAQGCRRSQSDPHMPVLRTGVQGNAWCLRAVILGACEWHDAVHHPFAAWARCSVQQSGLTGSPHLDWLGSGTASGAGGQRRGRRRAEWLPVPQAVRALALVRSRLLLRSHVLLQPNACNANESRISGRIDGAHCVGEACAFHGRRRAK